MLIKADISEDGVLRITIQRAEKRNALNEGVIAELKQVLDASCDDPELRLVVLTGAGDKAFASGGDLKELSAICDLAGATAMSDRFRSVLDRLRNFSVPVIAALNGDALGGGAELAMACDMRIADSRARFGFLQGKLAISTAWGGGIDLIREIGVGHALRLLAGAEILTAEAARDVGLFEAVAPADASFDDFVDAYCDRLANCTPKVMRAFKALASAHRRGEGHAVLQQIETQHFARTWIDVDHWRAVDASLGRAGRE